jgi:hypothetical protein
MKMAFLFWSSFSTFLDSKCKILIIITSHICIYVNNMYFIHFTNLFGH